MNILYLTNHLNTGGITSYLLTLSERLCARGHRLYLAASGGGLVERFRQIGVSFIPVPLKTKCEFSPKLIPAFIRLAGFLHQQDIDIIHANTRVTQVLAALLSRDCGRPYVCTCHGFFQPRLSRWLFPCWGSRVIAISAQVKEHLQRDFQLPAQRIAFITHGIDTKHFAPQTAGSLPCRPAGRLQVSKSFGLRDGPVIGIIARLSEVKGHRYLIEAMKEVLRVFNRAQLLIIGEGRIKESLISLVQGLGLEKNVIFLPSVADTDEILGCMDIFVLPSLKEGLGLGLMEAMAKGLAVIGSDVGGIKSLIRHQENGLLVKSADSHALAEAIIGLLSDDKKREALGGRAREFIAENFSADKMLTATERLYQECLNEASL